MRKWRTVKLEEVAKLDRSSVSPEQIMSGTSYLGLEHIESGGRIIADQVVQNGELKSSKFRFSRKHILYGKLRPYLAKISLPDFEGVCSTDIIPILPDNDVDKEFLFYFLKQEKMVEFANSKSSGANLPRLSPKELANFDIPLPPLAEQKRIAQILDTADEIRAKRRQSIEELDQLAQSVFLDMFGDPVTNPKGWEERTITDLVSDEKHSLKRGPFGGALKKEIFVDSGYKVYEQKNVIKDNYEIGSYFISEYDYKRLSAFNVVPGDVLISCSGTIGKIAVIPNDAIPGVMNQALLKIRLDESIVINPFFISLWTSPSFEQNVLGMVHGTGMKNMKSMSELKQIKFITPPMDIQLKFLSIIQSIEAQKSLLQQHLAELDNLFASLQARAFNGEL